MKVKLIRYSLPDRPDWVIVDEKVPIGTVYEVVGYHAYLELVNFEILQARIVSAYLLIGNDGVGYLPTGLFETVEEEITSDQIPNKDERPRYSKNVQ